MKSNHIKVDVYYNLTKKVFSVRHNGLVIDHKRNLMLKDAKFIVSEKGRQRVLKQRRKNVHAIIRGELVAAGSIEEPRAAYYNPYKVDSFVDYKTREPVHHSDMVMLKLGKYNVPEIIFEKSEKSGWRVQRFLRN